MVRIFTAFTQKGESSPLGGVADALKDDEDAQRMDEALRLQAEQAEHDRAMDDATVDLENRKLEQRILEALDSANEAAARIQSAEDLQEDRLEHSRAEGGLDRESDERLNEARIKGAAAQNRARLEAAAAVRRANDAAAWRNVRVTIGAATDQSLDLETGVLSIPGPRRPGKEWREKAGAPLVRALQNLNGATPETLATLLSEYKRVYSQVILATDEKAKQLRTESLQRQLDNLEESLLGEEGVKLGIPPEAVQGEISGGGTDEALSKDIQDLIHVRTSYVSHANIRVRLGDMETNPDNPNNARWLRLVGDSAFNENLPKGDENFRQTGEEFDRNLTIFRNPTDNTIDEINDAGRALEDLADMKPGATNLINELGTGRRRAQRELKETTDANDAKNQLNAGVNTTVNGLHLDFNPHGVVTNKVLSYLGHSGNKNVDSADAELARRILGVIKGAEKSYRGSRSTSSLKTYTMSRILELAASPQDLERLGAGMSAVMQSPGYLDFSNAIDNGANLNRELEEQAIEAEGKADREKERLAEERAEQQMGLHRGGVPR